MRFPNFLAIPVSALLCTLLFSIHAHAKDDMRSINYEGVNVRAGAGTNHDVHWRVIKHFPYQVVQTKGEWVQVKDFEGDSGWVHSRYLSEGNSVVVKNTFANLRAAPSLSAQKIGRADYGDVFVALTRRGDWVQIQWTEDKTAWIYRPLVWGALFE